MRARTESIFVTLDVLLSMALLLALLTVTSESLGTKTETTTGVSTTTTTAQLYNLTFHGIGECGGSYAILWAVQIGNLTISQPPNTPLSEIENVTTYDVSSQPTPGIVFSLPTGEYQYTLYPKALMQSPVVSPTGIVTSHWTGVVSVFESDVSVNVTVWPQYGICGG